MARIITSSIRTKNTIGNRLELETTSLGQQPQDKIRCNEVEIMLLFIGISQLVTYKDSQNECVWEDKMISNICYKELRHLLSEELTLYLLSRLAKYVS